MIVLMAFVGVGCAADPPAPAPPGEAAEARAVAEPDPPPEPRVEPLPVEGPFRRQLAPGLVVAAYAPPEVADIGFSRAPAAEVAGIDDRLFVVTIDPALYELTYLSVLDETRSPSHQTGPEWAEKHDMQVVWNPGMFEPDAKATGHTRAGPLTSQPRVRRGSLYRGWFLLEDGGRTASTVDQVPPKGTERYVELATLPQAFRSRVEKADLVSQSLPILRDGRAAYPARKNHWSELAYGTDDEGRIVVVFSRFPYEMRELGHRLAALELGLSGLIHGEGGPEATLLVRAGGVELLKFGSYETGFFDDSNQRPWGLPAVLGARPRDTRQ